MATYPTCSAPGGLELDYSRWLWDVWNFPAVKAWLRSSRSPRQCQKRAEIAADLFRRTLQWSIGQAVFVRSAGLEFGPELYNLEEFCWAGVKPTAEAERVILEYAGEIGAEYKLEADLTPEDLCHLLLKRNWVAKHPVHESNGYLLHLLGRA